MLFRSVYKSSLWVVDLSTGRNRKLAERGGAKSPVWLDSGRILFVSGRDKMEHEDKPCTRYYEISVNGGEASLYLTVPVKADKIRPIGDKLWLLSAVADENESKTREINQHARTWDEVAVRGKDYDIYEELPFRFNGKGVINRKRPVLYLFSEADSSLKRITPKFLETVSYDVSPDHKYVAFCGPVFDSIRRMILRDPTKKF